MTTPRLDAPAVITISGIMAAGKSTVAELLAAEFARSVHVRGDLFRRLIVNGRAPLRPGFPGDGREQLRLRHRLTAAAANLYAAAGFTVVVQDVLAGAFLREYLQQVQHRPHFLVLLMPRPEVVAERERGRGKIGYGDGWTVEDLDRDFRSELPEHGLRLDTSAMTAEETVREILARYQDEALL
jgi:chloramphenicol 3-O-phosphotransferase